MQLKETLKKFSPLIAIFALIIAIVFFWVFTSSLSSTTTASAWDGSVSTSFEYGNGTKNNPYIISSGSDLAYLKQLLESDEVTTYNDKYYKLDEDINLGDREFYIDNIETFIGGIDGDAYTIYNGVIKGSLFNSVEGAEFKNINFQNNILENIEDEVSALLASESKNSLIENVVININQKVENDTYVGSILGIDEGSQLNNIVIKVDYEYDNNYQSNIALVLYKGINTKLDNVLIFDNSTLSDLYLENEGIEESKVLKYTNSNISNLLNTFFESEEYKFEIKDGNVVFTKIVQISLMSFPVSSFTEHASGIDGNTVHINDLEADYNYYYGQNYVSSSNGTVPTGNNQNIYNDSNLVRVKIRYSGVENLNGVSYTGTISLTETQNEMIYYKYYPVVNGKVRIELIDNPFTNRPNDKAFNNWVVDYEHGTIIFDYDVYKRYLEFDVTYTNGKPDDVEIPLHASWVEATAYEKTSSTATNNTTVGSFGYIFTNLKAKGPTTLTHSNDYVDQSMAGYYVRVSLSNGTSLAGYYNASGQYLTSGTSSSTSTVYYRLIQSEDTDRIYNSSTTYYYMVTRDTNIVYLTSNFTSNSGTSTGRIWTSNVSSTKPFTFTGVYNGVDYDVTWSPTSYVTMYNDATIENMTINCGGGNSFATTTAYLPTGTSTSRMLYGNSNNIKLGRGIKRSNSNTTFYTVIGGYSGTVGSSSNIKRYTVTVESGFYNNIILTGLNSTTTNTYVNLKSVYGNDYDRVTNNNSNLDVFFIASGSRGANVYGSSSIDIAIDSVVKSGTFGSSRNDYTTGIYIGGLTGGTHYAIRQAKVEGGSIYNLIGGPLSATDRSLVNDIYIYQTGGTIDMITAGAGRSRTYGNRIMSLTGGMVNYSVLGGSNSYNGTESNDGQLSGASFIYVGGNAQIGNPTYVANNSTLYTNGTINAGIEAGSVFGIGNGRNGVALAGSNDNSNIIVDGNAHILRNVYGGGNYGATGAVTTQSSTTTNINILDGQIDGDVYGGGNRNGSGVLNKESTITINVSGGTINGSVYGGSNISGTIYGTTNLNINRGNVGSVYGGGQGNATYVSKNVTVNIGTSSYGPTIVRDVNGGSAFGTVNSTVANTTRTEYPTNVTVNNGIINGAVFGGGEGNNTYTPYVAGDIVVNINNGNIGYVYGGNDQAGTPNGSVKVYLNGGTIGESYGGGNRSSVRDTEIYLQGATTTYLFGGSNTSGSVNSSKVTITSGTATSVYGGNNIGGSLATSNVYVNGGKIISEVYGGGNEVITTTTNLYLNNASETIPYAFGGGHSADVVTTNVYQNGAPITRLFGGSNTSGTVTRSNIEYVRGTTMAVFGGNNAGGITNNANVNVTGGKITNLLGGGNQTDSGTAVVNVNIPLNYDEPEEGEEPFSLENPDITNIYGGANEAGINNTTINLNSGIISNVYGGSNRSGTVNNTTINSNEETVVVGNLFGGNNAGGLTVNPQINITSGVITNVYGGGNLAVTTKTDVNVNGGSVGNIYGGGNEAAVTGNTELDILGGYTTGNIYGGGNYGTVGGNTKLYVNDAVIAGSIYAGGNGVTAVVSGNTEITVDGYTVVGGPRSMAPHYGSVFGGGNAAATGEASSNNSKATVNIAGGTIYGNVYGGANTSVVYGKTDVNIGVDTISNYDLTVDELMIRGTIFGGGEANAAGSEEYDYSFISVTDGISVNIDGNGYTNFSMQGSIFGSGNASSTQGQSTILIKNYGSISNPQQNVSIQRTNILTIDNSAIVLSGATDRTNEFSDVLFTLSIIDNLKLKNNSTLFLETGANLLKKLESITSSGEYASVIINDENKTVTKNVDNRIYMLEGKNLNVATNESVTSYGEIFGMTFLGMYTADRETLVNMGIYDPSFNYGDNLDWGLMPTKGSYVLGLHMVDHDIGVNGFYSNYMGQNEKNEVEYVQPQPEDSNFYMWIIGEAVIEYEIDLTASKFSTLGTAELTFLEFSKPNTSFQVIGFDYGSLNDDVSLIDSNTIPRVATTNEEANKVMGLSMKTGNAGWLNKGETKFFTNEPSYTNTTYFVGENTSDVPSLLFYLYHSKNINENGDLGRVAITIMTTTKIDALTMETERLVIYVNLHTALYQNNDYEGAMTAGREYEMFSSTLVNITAESSFSAYYALYAEENLYRNGYHRVLVSTYVLPAGTKITMIDFVNEVPVYYYYVVTEQDVIEKTIEYNAYGEASYKLSKFTKMGSINSNDYYDDEEMNQIYYSSVIDKSNEEFIFIVDFEDSNINSDQLDKSLIIEMRDDDEQTIISVLGIQHQNLIYNIYANQDAVIDVDGTVDPTTLYIGHSASLNIVTSFINNKIGSNTIYDTRYFDSKLGANITLIDNDGNQINGTTLLGVSFVVDGVRYYPNLDGSTRIKIADRVGSAALWVTVDTTNSTLVTGDYKIQIESFGSADGIYYGLDSSDTVQIPIRIINEIYGLNSEIADYSVIIEGKSGLNQNKTNELDFTLRYNSGLNNPRISMKLYRRKYNEVHSTDYELVDFVNYIDQELTPFINSKEYLVTNDPQSINDVSLPLKSNLKTGTYRIDFNLYDDDVYIGNISRYIIIK